MADTEHTLHRYGLSMFHQLHCLGMIRGAMQAALGIKGSHSVLRSRHTDESVDMHPSDDDHGDPAHWLHCFDYLRQVRLASFLFRAGSIKPLQG
ncbi:hypothetical protein MKX07_005058 [Trichoderma sp. CBMAI-0711]|nr:hypothetical protein MKX07_005058 [Trichoderma sp. CBMAI-0711]